MLASQNAGITNRRVFLCVCVVACARVRVCVCTCALVLPCASGCTWKPEEVRRRPCLLSTLLFRWGLIVLGCIDTPVCTCVVSWYLAVSGWPAREPLGTALGLQWDYTTPSIVFMHRLSKFSASFCFSFLSLFLLSIVFSSHVLLGF